MSNLNKSQSIKYCDSLTNYQRRLARVVKIGEVPLGGDYPIRIQSMTTVDTMDTMGSVAQSIRMIESGCDYVRITAPSIKEAQNLALIKKKLRDSGFQTPLVADIHFTPNAAELAARIVEKVRINPGNYADKKKFEVIEYTKSTYQAELERIRNKFSPLVKICKEYGTAMRIGTNHGSLSDRILSRYGDTPLGMVESALEFIRICEDFNYYDLVLSMKSSNPIVMVQAYRLLVEKLDEEGLQPYPLHLGVTEAGEAEDGRIKSAVGIGTLLEDGLGDTVRVSLTEAPEAEAPVAQLLVNKAITQKGRIRLKEIDQYPINPYHYSRRSTKEVGNFGGQNVPRVIADFSSKPLLEKRALKAVGHFYLSELDKWKMNDLGCDYLFLGDQVADFMLPNGLKQIVNYEVFKKLKETDHIFPLISYEELTTSDKIHKELNFLLLSADNFNQETIFTLRKLSNFVIMLESKAQNTLHVMRSVVIDLISNKINLPIVFKHCYPSLTDDDFRIHLATDFGGLLIDGFGDGTLMSSEIIPHKLINETVFGTLQAARTRITKTEYIPKTPKPQNPFCFKYLFELIYYIKYSKCNLVSNNNKTLIHKLKASL